MARGWFVTGTDTGVGKTLVSQALLRALAQTGLRVAGMKPVASGCHWTLDGLRSSDAEALQAAGNVATDYSDVNPYALESATAPQLAAQQAGVQIEIEMIHDCFQRLARRAEAVVVEGVGGWLVPIRARSTMADVVLRLELPVILVVGLRLGAINHALLAQAAIRAQGCRLAGWVANCIDAETPEGYLQSLQEHLSLPRLGVLPHGVSADAAAKQLDIGLL